VKFPQVRVTHWCVNPQDSTECLQLIMTNQAQIATAIATNPWTSKRLDPKDADDFIKCIKNRGGDAKLLP